MHWEKEIHIRITWRRVVGTILTASTVANLIIVGAAFGADALPAPTGTAVSTTSLPTSALSGPAGTAGGTSISGGPPTDTPGIPLTDALKPTQTSTDVPLSILCIKRFYWPTYYVQPGDRLFAVAFDTGSSVRELMAANCLANDRIYAGQRLYVPRQPIGILITLTATSTLTQMPTATETPTSTATFTNTVMPSATMTPTSSATTTPTATYTPTTTQTPTNTPTSTQTATASAAPSPTNTMSQTPTSTATVTSSIAPSATATPTNTLYITGTIPGITQTVVIGAN